MPWMGPEGLTTITCPSDTRWCWLCPGGGRLTGEPGPLRATHEAPKTEDKTHAVTEGGGGSTILVTLAVTRSIRTWFWVPHKADLQRKGK